MRNRRLLCVAIAVMSLSPTAFIAGGSTPDPQERVVSGAWPAPADEQ